MTDVLSNCIHILFIAAILVVAFQTGFSVGRDVGYYDGVKTTRRKYNMDPSEN